HVEKLELIGMDFIWKVAVESPDEEIANEAIQLIINYSYINLNPRLKKDSVSLHKKFIADCYTRLEVRMLRLWGRVFECCVPSIERITQGKEAIAVALYYVISCVQPQLVTHKKTCQLSALLSSD
ncbi:hypothetical protein AB205_0042420, partial [Aquarana catesbeiana]